VPAELDGRRLLRGCVQRIETRSRLWESFDTSACSVYSDRVGDHGPVLLVQCRIEGIQKMATRSQYRPPVVGSCWFVRRRDGGELGRAGAFCQGEVEAVFRIECLIERTTPP